jgi:hypothetical protein
MALAVLEFVGESKGKIWFNIDTGSNPYYQVKIGKGVLDREGNHWIDGIAHASKLAHNESGGQLFNSSKTIGIPTNQFDRNTPYVQLFSYKSPDGKAPAFSRVLKVPLGLSLPGRSLSLSTAMNTVEFERPRTVPCRTCKEEYSQQASIEDLLAGIVKLAAPAVMDALKKGGGTGGGADATGMVTNLLKTILGAITNPAPAVGSPQAGGSKPMSLSVDNRFSRPFIFGIDDALLATLAGPIIQALPQLMNAANQQRLSMKQEDNKLISGIVSDVNKRLLMSQLADAQKSATAAGSTPSAEDVKKLIELLSQSQPATPQTAVTKSLSVDPSSLSSKAVLSFEFAPGVQWQGSPKVLFARNQAIQLNVKLAVAEPAPKSPLDRAIIKVVFKDSDHKPLFEKTFKQKTISANAPLPLAFTADELSKVPANGKVSIVAEMRWLTSRGERKALGSAEVVFVDKYFVKEKGSSVSAEVELRDMNRYRAFWNKVWEAPTLDSTTNRGDNKKFNWELDVTAKYTVLLSPDHQANGLMQTKILKGKTDPDSLTDLVQGKMKAGIELSLSELNKLASLFDKGSPLDSEKFRAIATAEFAKANGSELTYPLKLRGKAGARGAVWIIPVFRLFEITLGSPQKPDASGQIVAIGEEKVRFPLPVSVRVIGLKSA